MTIKAVFFDLGGVIVRTEFQSPRQQLAERLGMEYDDLDKIVFNSDSSLRASMGEIPADEHWASVIKRLKRPASELAAIRDEFFAGDIVDRTLTVAGVRPFRVVAHPECAAGKVDEGAAHRPTCTARGRARWRR